MVGTKKNYKQIFGSFINSIIHIFILSVSVFSLNTTTETVNPFNEFMSPASGVDLYSGNVVQPVQLITLPSNCGLDINVSMVYSSNVYTNARSRNDLGPTKWCGLGWRLGSQSIVCNHNSTKTNDDDEYYLISATGTSQKLVKKVGKFYLPDNPYWKIEKIDYNNDDLIEKWVVTDINGNKYNYGGDSATEYTLYWQTSNYVGKGFGGNPSQYPYKWNLKTIEDPYGNAVQYRYDNINKVPDGGWTSQSYTQASYLKEIIGTDGSKVTFERNQKNSNEYLESDYMNVYEKEYLEKISVRNPSTDTLKSYYFCYKIVNNDIEGYYAKRLLTDVIEFNSNGEKTEKTSFEYYSDESRSEENGYPYCVLRSIKTPTCGRVEYEYIQKEIESVSISESILSRILTKDFSLGTVDGGYEYVIRKSNDSLCLVQWNGAKWEEKNTDVDFGSSKINQVLAAHNFYIVIFNDRKKMCIMNWNEKEWDRLSFEFDIEGDRQWQNKVDSIRIGNDFFSTIHNDSLYIFTVTNGEINEKVIYIGDGSKSLQTAHNTIAVEIKKSGNKSYKVYKRVGVYDWNIFSPPGTPQATTDKSISLGPDGNYFILWYEPQCKDYIYFYNWNGEEWVETRNRFAIKKFCGDAMVYPGNNYFVIRHQSQNYINVFDWNGIEWERSRKNEKITRKRDLNIHASRDYFVTSYDEDSYLRIYYKSADLKWKKRMLGNFKSDAEKKVACGNNSVMFFYGRNLIQYAWDSNDGWNRKPDIISNSSFWNDTFMAKNDMFLFYSDATEFEVEIEPVTVFTRNLLKLNLFKKYQDSFQEQIKIILPVKKKIADNNTNVEHIIEYNYDDENSNFDTQKGGAKFNKVETIIPGNGKTVKHFYNDNQSEDSSTSYLDELDGLVYKEEIIDNDSNIISQTETEYEVYRKSEWPATVKQKRALKTESESMGLTAVNEIKQYDTINGLPLITSTTKGNTTITNEVKYSYTEYPEMNNQPGNLNMLSQQCQKLVYNGDSADINNVMGSNVTTWSSSNDASCWLPSSTFVWNVETNDDGTPAENMVPFNFSNPSSNIPNSWDYTGSITKYTQNGIKIENSDAEGIRSVSIPGYDKTKVIAEISNAKYDECAIFTCDYDDGIDAAYFDYFNGWEKGGTDITFLRKHFGSKSLNIQPDDEGISKNLTVSKKDYVFSCWVYSTEECNINLNIFRNNGTEINPDKAIKSVSVNNWIKVEREIKKDEFSADENIKINVSVSGSSPVNIDDIRFHPKKAMVTTYYYDPVWKNVIAKVGVNDNASYITYDNEGRPVLWRNNDKQIIQEKEYNRMVCNPNVYDATLKDISLSEGYIDFDPQKFNYHVYYQNSVDKIDFTPVVNNSDATLIVDGNVIPCPCGNPIELYLPEGQTTVNMVVIAPNETDNNNYSIIFERMNTCWTFAGNREISTGKSAGIQVKTSSDGTNYMAFIDKGNGNKLFVKKLVAGVWENVGSGPVSEGETNTFSFKIANNNPVVAYVDDSDTNSTGLLKAKIFNSGAWQNIGNTIATDVSGTVDLTHNGTSFYIAYLYEEFDTVSDDGNSFIMAKQFNGTDWVDLGINGIVSDEGGSGIRIGVTNTNTCYIGYIHDDTDGDDDAKADKPVIKRLVGTTWQEIPEVAQNYVSNFDMEIIGNTPYVALGERSGSTEYGEFINRVFVKKFQSGSWSKVGNEEFLFEIDENGFIDLSYEGNKPYLAFSNENNKFYVSVLEYNSTAKKWYSLGNPAFIRAKREGTFSLNNHSGDVYLGCTDYNRSDKACFLKYEDTDCYRAVLSDLQVNGFALDHDFRHYIINYNVEVDALTDYVEIFASTDIPGASVIISESVNNTVKLHSGVNRIPVIVTGADLMTHVIYELKIIKPLSATASLCKLELFDENMATLDFSPEFSPQQKDYSITVSDQTENVIVKLATPDGSSTVINGAICNVKSIPLYYGINKVSLMVVAPDAKNRIYYNISVLRSIPDELSLSSLTIPSVTLDPPFDPSNRDTYYYTASVPNSTEQVTVTPVPYSGSATVSVNGGSISEQVNLNSGLNEIYVNVNHPDYGEAQYIVSITRAPSSASGLSSITITGNDSIPVTLTPSFSNDVVLYNASIASDISKLLIEPVAMNPDASVVVNEEELPSSGKMTLNPQSGINDLKIAVISETPLEETNYYVTVNKQISAVSPVVGFENTRSSTVEGNNIIEIPVVINGPIYQNASVDYSVSSSDADLNDYSLEPGTLEFNPCETRKIIYLEIKDDLLTEDDETIVITLHNSINVDIHPINNHTHTIIDNDERTISFTAHTGSGSKSVSNPVINVRIDPVPVSGQNFTVQYSVTGGSAKSWDYVLENGSLTFDSLNPVKQIPLVITGLSYGTKDIEISLSGPTNGAVIGSYKTFRYIITDNTGIRFVRESAVSMGDGLSWATAYRYLQNALLEASTNSEIKEVRVAAGTYYPTNSYPSEENLRDSSFILVDSLTLLGGYPEGGGDTRDPDNYETILSGDIDGNGDLDGNSYNVIESDNVKDITIDGFIITGGNANGYSGDSEDRIKCVGGGLRSVSSTVNMINCDVISNVAWYYGGGFYIDTGHVLLENCVFEDNSSTHLLFKSGCGIYLNNATLEIDNSRFINNCFAGSRDVNGGAISIEDGNVHIQKTMFTDNRTDNGGAIYAIAGDLLIDSCEFENNGGSALFLKGSNNQIENCKFNNNYGESGGAINCKNGVIKNSIFLNNETTYNGGAIFLDKSENFIIINSTFSKNNATGGYGGAIAGNGSDAVIKNSIFWYNNAIDITIDIFENVIGESEINTNYNDFQQTNISGNNNIFINPEFCNSNPAIYENLKLQNTSPCIDAADPSDYTSKDIEGNSRGNAPDMGAYEYIGEPCN